MSNYFRNIEAIGDIDPGCLWQNDGMGFILVDDDNYRHLGDEWAHLMLPEPDPPSMGCPTTDHHD